MARNKNCSQLCYGVGSAVKVGPGLAEKTPLQPGPELLPLLSLPEPGASPLSHLPVTRSSASSCWQSLPGKQKAREPGKWSPCGTRQSMAKWESGLSKKQKNWPNTLLTLKESEAEWKDKELRGERQLQYKKQRPEKSMSHMNVSQAEGTATTADRQRAARRLEQLQFSEREQRVVRDKERQLRNRTLQTVIRTLDFILSVIESHWRILSRRVA